ncbi:MAG: PEGA domain-containing protein [Deltaproteobacteria bacterium]|nr:PEGA domain-containing protein [Deltaproteobacteria bacterium]
MKRFFLIAYLMCLTTTTYAQVIQGATGNINIQSEPKGAEVYLNGTYMGNTPLALKNIDAGEHVIKVTKAGYVDAETTITLNPKENRNIKIILEETPETREKRLKYQSALDRYEASMEEYRQISRPKRIWGFSLLGAGIATGITATIFYIKGMGDASSAYNEYKNSVLIPDIDSRFNAVKDGESMITLGHIMTGITTALIGASLYQFLTIPSKPVEPKPFTINTNPNIRKDRVVFLISTTF